MNNPMQQFLMQLLKSKSNPQQIIQQMIATNPQAKAMLNQMRQSGMNPKEFTMQYAKQNNIDLQSQLDMFNNFGIKL